MLFFSLVVFGDAGIEIIGFIYYLPIQLAYGLLGLAGISFLCFLIKLVIQKINIRKYYVFLIIIFVVTLRFSYYMFVQSEPTSDFKAPFVFAEYLQKNGSYVEYSNQIRELDSYQIYYASYPAWAAYMY